MRAPAVLAAIALAGTVLLGGAAQALADGPDDGPANDVGRIAGDSDEVFGPASHTNANLAPDATGFRKLGGTFDWASEH